jgi:hypothetical protein
MLGALYYIDITGCPVSPASREKIKKAKQKLLLTELAQHVHPYSQYTNLAVLTSQETSVSSSSIGKWASPLTCSLKKKGPMMRSFLLLVL